MKKLLSILMVFVLVFASMLVFASCGGTGDNGDGGDGGDGGDDLTLTVGGLAEADVPTNFNSYTKGVDVDVYTPSGWSVYSNAFSGIQIIDTTTRNEITIKGVRYDANTGYQAMTLERFETEVVEPLRASNFEIVSFSKLADDIFYCEYVNALGTTVKLTNAYLNHAEKSLTIVASAQFVSDLGTTDVLNVVFGTLKTK